MTNLPIVRPLQLDDITAIIIDVALQIHRALGPSLLETLYQRVLTRALQKRGLTVQREAVMDIRYDGDLFEQAIRIDLLIETSIVVELKSTPAGHPAHAKQVLTYLRLTGLQVGLLLNFGAPRLSEGLQRIVNDAPERVGRLEIHHSETRSTTHSRPDP